MQSPISPLVGNLIMDHYLHWDRNHIILNKYSVFNTLTYWAWTVCSDQQLLGQHINYNISGLPLVGTPDWVFHRLQTKLDYQLSLLHHNNKHDTHKDINNTKYIFIVVPYSRGLSESFKNICGKTGVQVHLKGNNTIKDLLVALQGQG